MKKFQREFARFISYAEENLNLNEVTTIDDNIKNLGESLIFLFNFFYTYQRDLNIRQQSLIWENGTKSLVCRIKVKSSVYDVEIHYREQPTELLKFRNDNGPVFSFATFISNYRYGRDEKTCFKLNAGDIMWEKRSIKTQEIINETYKKVLSELSSEVKLWYLFTYNMDLDELLNYGIKEETT